MEAVKPMDLASVLAIAAGSSVLTALVTVAGNGIFGWAKGRADAGKTTADTATTYGEMYAKMYADFAAIDAVRAKRDDERIGVLVAALENLTDAVDRMVRAPLMVRLTDDDDDPMVLDFRKRAAALRDVNSEARRAI